jgi:hypothetical protein
LVLIAALLAGPRLASDIETWLADLRDSTGADGQKLSRRGQIAYALGLLCAALLMRLDDAGAWCGRRVDWWLSTDIRVLNASILVFLGCASNLFRQGGITHVIENGENLGVLTAGVWGAAFVLRRVRGVTARVSKKRAEAE